MPHLSIEYSANVEQWTSLAELCDVLRLAAAATGLSDAAGIRVRALRCDTYSIADGKADRGFIDISVRLRGGRALDTRKQATQRIFEAAEQHLEEVLAAHPLALSLEMRDIDPELSPKLSTLRQYVREQQPGS